MTRRLTLWFGFVACGPPQWHDAPVDDLVTAHHFWVRGVGADQPVQVRCASTTDPDEEHVAEGVSRDDVLVAGLLADHDYACTLTARGMSEVRPLHTDPLPDDLPQITVTGDTDGYTLFSVGKDVQSPREPKLLIVDPQGRIRWYRRFEQNATDLDATWLDDGTLLVGGGFALPPHRLALDGSILDQAIGRVGEPPHHHVEQRPGGTVLTLVEVPVSNEEESWRGFRVDELQNDLRGTVWSWDAQQAVDDGWLPPPPTERRDPYHANALVDLGDQLWVSLRQMSRIAVLDRDSGELQFTLGRGGDFDLVDPSGKPLSTTEWFFGQHAPKVAGDRLLVHDNGWDRPSGPRFSRVVEYQLDVEARRATRVWSWTEPGWYEPIWGDADWLASGHVLVTRGHCDTCLRGVSGNTQLIEVDPATDEVVWRLVLEDSSDTGYRAQRIDECSIFGNGGLCEALR